MATFPRPETWRWTKQTVIGCLTRRSNGLMGRPWPMKAAMDFRPSAVSLKVWLRETKHQVQSLSGFLLTHTVGTEWHHILVIEHNFGNPDGVWGNSDGGDAQIMIRIPSELHVCPLLNAERHEFICKADPHTNKTVKKAMCVGCVPMTKYYQNRTQWQEQNKGLIKIINISY